MEAKISKIYSQKGKEVGTITLPEKVFSVKWNSDLVHQVSIGMEANARINYADTKGRGEVRGGGKKPWKQKGTGRARHGSSRSPIWKGGGVTHGPLSEKNYSVKINRKMKIAALFSALSRKVKDEQVLFLDNIDLTKIKTADANVIVQALATIPKFDKLAAAKKPIACLVLSENNQILKKSFRNIPSLIVEDLKNVNVLDVMKYRYMIMVDPKSSVEYLEAKITKDKVSAVK